MLKPHNIIKFCLPSLIFIFSSCHYQELKFVALDSLSNNFDVSSFFDKRLKQTEKILAIDPKKIDKKEALKLLDNPFFVKDTLGLFKTDGGFPTELSLQATNYWISRNKKPTEIFGYEYKTVAYNEKNDTLAILNSVVFPKISMAEDKKGNLIFLEVSKTSKILTDYEKVKKYFEKNCRKVIVENDDTNISYWANDHFFFQLTKEEIKEEISSYDSQGNKNLKQIDVTKIDLAIYEKSYVKRMQEKNIYSPGEVFWDKIE